MLDTRREIAKITGSVSLTSYRRLSLMLGCVLFSVVVSFVPEYTGLSPEARQAFFILLLAASLWVTEALPAFAVALLVISLEIGILGSPDNWEMFVAPWSSSLMWLFFGGLILAQAATKTGLDTDIAHRILRLVGSTPPRVLLGMMLTTFILSMFMSNTATTAMMLTVVAPIVKQLRGNPFSKAMLLGIPFAANIGGMGTLIGSPPNAIAAAALATEASINFVDWMLFGLPPALILVCVAWVYLMISYKSTQKTLALPTAIDGQSASTDIPHWKRVAVLATFFATIGLWLTTPLHHIPTSMISFLPIGIFAAINLLEADDIRSLSWDVLLLLAGGLSLGVMVTQTGLADWLIQSVPVDEWGIFGLAFGFAYLTTVVSNFMSNTAAANIIVPLAAAAAGASAPLVVIPVALGASAAMCLPISTPPNAIAYTHEGIESSDFLKGGLLIGFLAPLLGVFWCMILL